MTETTQEERNEIEDRLLGYPADTLVTENHDLRVDQTYRLLSDADRLHRAEELLRAAQYYLLNDYPDEADMNLRIDAYFGERNDR